MSEGISQYENFLHLPLDKHLFLISGKADSGKTFMVMDTISRIQCRKEGPMFARVLVLSPTFAGQPAYSRGWDKRDVYDDPDEYADIIDKIFAFQKGVEESMRQRILIMIDDCVGVLSKPAEFRRQVSKLCTSGRNYGIALWMLTQNLKDNVLSTPNVRGQISCIISTFITDTSKEKFEKMMPVDKKVAPTILSRAWSEPYRAVACDLTTAASGSTSRISFIKVDAAKVFRFAVKYRD